MDHFLSWKKKLHRTFRITMYGCNDENEYQENSRKLIYFFSETLDKIIMISYNIIVLT